MSGPGKSDDAGVRRLEIKNKNGLHARAAKTLIDLAERFAARITINDQAVVKTNMLGLLMLAAAQGTFIDVTADGPDAEAALSAIEALIDACFNEGE